jgi:hypothetical protein
MKSKLKKEGIRRGKEGEGSNRGGIGEEERKPLKKMNWRGRSGVLFVDGSTHDDEGRGDPLFLVQCVRPLHGVRERLLPILRRYHAILIQVDPPHQVIVLVVIRWI